MREATPVHSLKNSIYHTRGADKGKLPFVPLRLKGVKRHALLDTGATVSVIQYSLVEPFLVNPVVNTSHTSLSTNTSASHKTLSDILAAASNTGSGFCDSGSGFIGRRLLSPAPIHEGFERGDQFERAISVGHLDRI